MRRRPRDCAARGCPVPSGWPAPGTGWRGERPGERARARRCGARVERRARAHAHYTAGSPAASGPRVCPGKGPVHRAGVSRVSWDPPESRDVLFPGLRGPGSPVWVAPSPLGCPEGTGFRKPGILGESSLFSASRRRPLGGAEDLGDWGGLRR